MRGSMLSSRLTLEAPLRVEDGAGGATVTWIVEDAVWAHVEPQAGRERLVADAATERVAYSPDWAEALKRETLIEAARRHFDEITPDEAGAGDVVLFRLNRAAMAKHAAILTGGGRMIHAMSGAATVEVTMGPWWRRRIAAAFRFPGLEG